MANFALGPIMPSTCVCFYALQKRSAKTLKSWNNLAFLKRENELLFILKAPKNVLLSFLSSSSVRNASDANTGEETFMCFLQREVWRPFTHPHARAHPPTLPHTHTHTHTERDVLSSRSLAFN